MANCDAYNLAQVKEGTGHGCGFCLWVGENGKCEHKTHRRFQREPNIRCRLYRYGRGAK